MLGGLDILVNNAGFQWAREEGVEEITDDRLDRVLKTNLYSLFWMTRAAVPHLSRGLVDHQHELDPGVRAVADAARLRVDQGGDQQLHDQPRR